MLTTSPAFGQEREPQAERERIRIRYEAAPSCPSYDEFIEKVREYTTRWTLAVDGDKARHFRLKLEPREGRIAGTLEVSEPDSDAVDASASRTIMGPDCEAVARGMVIAVAVAIDPSAFFPEQRSEPGPVAEPPAPPPPPPPPPSKPRETPRPPPPPSKPTERGASFAVDARAELTTAVVSGGLPVVSAAFEMEPLVLSGHERSVRPRWLRPSLALGLRQSLPRSIERSSVTTEFLWTAAVLRLCPARFVSANGRLEIMPCVESDLGVLRASASGSSDARRTSKSWIDAGISARATWSIAGGWFVGGAASMILPISRNRFELSTGTLVSLAPNVGVTLGFVGGLRF